MINPYQSVYFSGLGANSVFIGFLLGVNSAVTALMQLVGGYVADAWGRRKVIVIFSFLSAATAFVFIFISEPALLMIPIVIGAISGIYGPAFNATLTDSMEPELRARGLVSFTLVTSLPSIFFPYIGGTLMQTLGTLEGLRIAFFFSGLLGVIGVSYRALTLKETYAGVRGKEKKRIRRLVSDFFTDNLFVLRNATDGAKKLLIYAVLASVGTAMTVPYTSIYLVNIANLPPAILWTSDKCCWTHQRLALAARGQNNRKSGSKEKCGLRFTFNSCEPAHIRKSQRNRRLRNMDCNRRRERCFTRPIADGASGESFAARDAWENNGYVQCVLANHSCSSANSGRLPIPNSGSTVSLYRLDTDLCVGDVDTHSNKGARTASKRKIMKTRSALGLKT